MKKTMLYLFVLLCIGYACSILPKEVPEVNHVTALPGFDIDSLYNEFLICSKDEGDAGCDSCWQLVMNGKVDDTYWKEH